MRMASFTTIWNYITPKLQSRLPDIHAGFYHYLELHHSQTGCLSSSWSRLFYHYLELHHSQTKLNKEERWVKFYHYLELHHSQTSALWIIFLRLFYHYLELHHSQTNLKFQSQFAYLLKSSTSKTAITWQCNSDMVKIYSKIWRKSSSIINKFSNSILS